MLYVTQCYKNLLHCFFACRQDQCLSNVYFHSFIHSFWPFLKRPFKSSTTQRRSRLQHGYCIELSRRSAQATVGKELAQGPYMAARAGVEPTTLRLKAIDSTKAPPCPISPTRSRNISIGFQSLLALNIKFCSLFSKHNWGWHLNISVTPSDFRPLPHPFVLYAPWTGGSFLSLGLGQPWPCLDMLPLLPLLFGIAFCFLLVLLSYHPIFLRPYHFLKLVSFLGANRTKSASVCLWLF